MDSREFVKGKGYKRPLWLNIFLGQAAYLYVINFSALLARLILRKELRRTEIKNIPDTNVI